MPTYQYACTACDHAFEIVQSFSDDALSVCPECEGRLRKVFNAVGVVFKGSGFYRNDSRNATTSSESGGSAASDSGTKTSSDTKKQDATSGSGSSSSGSAGSSSSSTTAAATAN